MEFITTTKDAQSLIQQHQIGKSVIEIPYDFREFPDDIPDASLGYTQPARMSRNTGHEDDHGNKLMLQGTDLTDAFEESLQRDLQDWFKKRVEVRVCDPEDASLQIEAEASDIIIFCLHPQEEA